MTMLVKLSDIYYVIPTLVTHVERREAENVLVVHVPGHALEFREGAGLEAWAMLEPHLAPPPKAPAKGRPKAKGR
jgi:hypothetical protein